MNQRRPARLTCVTLDPGPPLDNEGIRLLHGDRRIPIKQPSEQFLRSPSPSLRCFENVDEDNQERAFLTRVTVLSRPQSAPVKLGCDACAKKLYLQQQDCELTSLRLSYNSRRLNKRESPPAHSKQAFLTGAMYNSRKWLDADCMDKLWPPQKHVTRDKHKKLQLPSLEHSAEHLSTNTQTPNQTLSENQHSNVSYLYGKRQPKCFVKGSKVALTARPPSATFSHPTQSDPQHTVTLNRHERIRSAPGRIVRFKSKKCHTYNLQLLEDNDYTDVTEAARQSSAENLVTTEFKFESAKAEIIPDATQDDDNYMKVEITNVSDF